MSNWRRTGSILALTAAAGLRAAAPPSALVGGNTAFAAEIYPGLASRPGNLFFSPYSISLALSLAYAGARGDTAAEMARVLHLPADPAAAARGFAGLAGRFAAIPAGDASLDVGNSLWVQQSFRLKPDYLRLAREDFRAEVRPEDFLRQPAAAAGDINRWVSLATRGRIPELVAPGAIGPATRVVLASAIYFKGQWATPFRAARTWTEPFHSTAGRSAPVPMMHQTGGWRLAQLAGFRLLELPYRNDEISLVLLLPDAEDGLAALEKQVSAADLAAWLGRLSSARREYVRLSLPRFRASTAFDLSAPLRQLGLAAAFSPERADFSGLSATPRFCLSSVFHKAEVEVNEEGTVASAATGVIMQSLAVETRPPPEFRVDHPFLFLIRENSTGSVLFLGRIVSPQ